MTGTPPNSPRQSPVSEFSLPLVAGHGAVHCCPPVQPTGTTSNQPGPPHLRAGVLHRLPRDSPNPHRFCRAERGPGRLLTLHETLPTVPREGHQGTSGLLSPVSFSRSPRRAESRTGPLHPGRHDRRHAACRPAAASDGGRAAGPRRRCRLPEPRASRGSRPQHVEVVVCDVLASVLERRFPDQPLEGSRAKAIWRREHQHGPKKTKGSVYRRDVGRPGSLVVAIGSQ